MSTLLALLLSCAPEGGKPDDTGGETGTPPVTWSSLSGTTSYASTKSGLTRCDLAIALSGAPAPAEACPECEFVFSMTGTVTADGGTDECRPWPGLTWIAAAGYSDLKLAWADEITDPRTGNTVTDALLTGYDLDGGDYVLEDAWVVLAYAGGTYADVTRADDSITFGFHSEATYTYSYSYGWTSCADTAMEDAADRVSGNELDATLTPDGSTQDVYVFTGDAGDAVAFSVDVRDAATNFAPYLWLNGPDGCTLLAAVDQFECTAPPGGRKCPAMETTLPTTGAYELRVGSDGNAGGTTGTYRIGFTGLTNFEQSADETPARYTVDVPWTTDVATTLTLAP